MAKKAKKKKSASRAKKRPASKPNTSMRKTKKSAKKSYRAAHARAGLVYKKAKKKKAPRRPNPTRALQSKIAGMKPGVFYDTTLSGAHVRMKRVGQQLVIRPKAKRK